MILILWLNSVLHYSTTIMRILSPKQKKIILPIYKANDSNIKLDYKIF